MKNKKKLDKLIVYSLIVLLILIVVLVIVMLTIKKDSSEINKPPEVHGKEPNKITSYSLELKGKNEQIVFLGDEYLESGYEATDNLKNDYNNQVKITGTVDANKVGKYKLTYSFKNIKQERIIYVINKTTSYPYIELLGEKEINLKSSDTYQEPGYMAIDELDGDITNKVKIKQEGSATDYTITYSITNSEGKTYQTTRHIIKTEEQIILSIDNLEYTNDKVNINIEVEQVKFKYLKLPNGVVIKDKKYTYAVSENGTYNFIAYDTDNNVINKSITINNIDKEQPTGSCLVTVKDNISTIKITASDKKSGIKNYSYNGSYYTNNTITINSRLSNASIIIYDKVGNYKQISCQMNIIEQPMDGFILIGDSRFEAMKIHLGSNISPTDTIVAKGGEGIDWFIKTAIPSVNKILEQNPNKRYYIYSNLGYNDMKYNYDRANYAERLNELAKTTWKNHKVGFISVNPRTNASDSKNTTIKKYNSEQKALLNGVYYCDTYNGIGINNFKPLSSSDATHYNKETSILIYNYITTKCKF